MSKVCESYCNQAEYIDNDYICRLDGNRCGNTSIPNQYTCRKYDKQIKYNKKGNLNHGEYFN